jgi:soluble lytic murein transglycosylase-like protein
MKKVIQWLVFFIIISITIWFANYSIKSYNKLDNQVQTLTTPFIIVYANVEQLDLRSKYDIPETFSDANIDSVWAIKNRLGIPEHIPFNLLMKESAFDSNALSPDGCFGYMQLNPRYFKPCKSDENIRQGLMFLKEQYDRLGSWEKAVIYYNSGERMKSSPEFVDYILNHK